MGKSKLLVGTQLMAFAIHLFGCHIFFKYYELDIYGAGAANFLTNSVIFCVNRFKLNREMDIKAATTGISIFDKSVREDMGQYMKIGVPNMLTLFIELASYDSNILIVGYIGVA